MLMKVYGGTPVQQAEGLCDSCRHARIVRGRRTDEEIVVCGASMHAFQVTFKVTQCSEYSDQREPTYHELFHKAWILRPPTKRRAAGFVRAEDLEAREARQLLADCDDDGEELI